MLSHTFLIDLGTAVYAGHDGCPCPLVQGNAGARKLQSRDETQGCCPGTPASSASRGWPFFRPPPVSQQKCRPREDRQEGHRW